MDSEKIQETRFRFCSSSNRTTLGVSYGDNLDYIRQFAKNNGEGIAIENAALGSVQVGRIELWALTDCKKRILQLRREARCC